MSRSAISLELAEPVGPRYRSGLPGGVAANKEIPLTWKRGEEFNNECLQASVKHDGVSLEVGAALLKIELEIWFRINGVVDDEKYR